MLSILQKKSFNDTGSHMRWVYYINIKKNIFTLVISKSMFTLKLVYIFGCSHTLRIHGKGNQITVGTWGPR